MDASKFQMPLGQLANTLAFKVQREGPRLIPNPVFLSHDVFMLIRQAAHTYDLFFYLNADEKRHKEIGWKVAYGAVTLPLIRCMIDCLYNVTAMLDNPARGYTFRLSGYRKALEALDLDEKRYGGDADWDAYIARQRGVVDLMSRNDGFKASDMKTGATWPTLGIYLRTKKNTSPTPHQEFLQKLTYGFWREYSAMAHATFDGLLPTAVFYAPKEVPHEMRPQIDDFYERMIFQHISRMAAILLCLLTEVQAHFKFDGANINQRLHDIWKVLRRAPEVKELYDGRYKKLMKERGIENSGKIRKIRGKGVSLK